MLTCHRFLSALVVCGMIASPAIAKKHRAEPEAVDAQELVRQANDLWHLKHDYNGALAALNRAVEAAPDDTGIRQQRAYFFEVVSGIVPDKDTEKFKELARQDYAAIAAAEPDSIRGGVARDGLTRLSGTSLVPATSVPCPEDALAAHARAEDLYGAGRLGESVAEYRKAVEACPAAGVIWVNYADAYYRMGQYEKAEELFRKALSVDPWNRAGHRFLADTEAQLGHLDAALHEAALAVVSDPVYEAAWGSLRSLAEQGGRSWLRVYGDKPEVSTGSGDDGKKNVTINLPWSDSDRDGAKGQKHPAKRRKAGDPPDDDACWLAYAMDKALVLEGTVVENDEKGGTTDRAVDPKTMSALEIERHAARSALEVMQELSAKSTEASSPPFWSMMDRADRAGFLDEAIFLHMLDAPLAAEYPAFRDKDGERLAEYLETVVVPKTSRASARP